MKQFLFILLGFLIGCHSEVENYGDRFGSPLNKDRINLSLAEVSKNWSFHANIASREGYWNTDQPIREGVCLLRTKKIKWNETLELEWEQDEYISGKIVNMKKIDPDAGDGWESLTILYNYKLKKYSCYHISNDGLTELPLKKAKAIKNTWRIKGAKMNQLNPRANQ